MDVNERVEVVVVVGDTVELVVCVYIDMHVLYRHNAEVCAYMKYVYEYRIVPMFLSPLWKQLMF